MASSIAHASNAAIRIGTCGWHYPAAGGWNGPFYPKPRPRGFDELTFYAQSFDTVEVNSTFYGQPRADVSRTWAEKTPPGFEFSVKLYQQFTHPKMFRERVRRDLERALGTPGGAGIDDVPDAAVDALIEANVADIDEFKRGIEPLAAAGRLGPLLAQFPASFKDDGPARAHLSALLRTFSGHRVVVELRHRSWSDRLAVTRALLGGFGAAWAYIDEPKFQDSVQQDFAAAAEEPFTYVRLHGRNSKHWWRHASREERYDYLYSNDELAPVAETLKSVASRGKPAYAYANNHTNAQAVINAKELQALAGSDVGRPVSPALTARQRRT